MTVRGVDSRTFRGIAAGCFLVAAVVFFIAAQPIVGMVAGLIGVGLGVLTLR